MKVQRRQLGGEVPYGRDVLLRALSPDGVTWGLLGENVNETI